MDRIINTRAFKAWLDQNGESGLLKLAAKSNISYSTLDKIIRGKYEHVPNIGTRTLLSAAMKVPHDELFPFKRAGGPKS